ncbi:MAG: DUF1585 domain-containing protein, partial [Planctomycetaceae bacterium]
AEREASFARGFVESIIAYGLGRPYGFTDQDLAEDILTVGRNHSYTVKDLLYALVESRQFRTK